MTRFRLLWDDSRGLRVYMVGTTAIAFWLSFARLMLR